MIGTSWSRVSVAFERDEDDLVNARSWVAETSYDNGRSPAPRVEKLSLAQMRREDGDVVRWSGEVKLPVDLDEELADY